MFKTDSRTRMAQNMTSRERIEAALRHETPDRTPIFEYVLLPPIADYVLGRPFVEYAGGNRDWQRFSREAGWEAAVSQYAIDRLEIAERLGHDMLYVVPNPRPPAEKPKPNNAKPLPDDPVERVRLRVASAEESLTAFHDDRFLVYECLKEEMARRDLDLPILVPAYAHGIWTDVDLMQTMLLEPEIARRHFRIATERTLLLIEKYIALGMEQIGVGGDFAGNRPLISPQAYREFIVPEVKILSRRIHKAGRWAVNASDGDLWSVIADFLIGCEVDGYLEIDMSAGMDMRRLKESYGDRITLYGNMDCGNILSFGTPEEIRRQTRECVEAGWGNGGHIFCASNAITESVPAANYLAMVNEYRDMFGLPNMSL